MLYAINVFLKRCMEIKCMLIRALSPGDFRFHLGVVLSSFLIDVQWTVVPTMQPGVSLPFPPGPQIRFSGYAGVSRADGEQGRRHFLPPHQRSVFHYNSPSRHCQMLSLSCSKLKTGVKSDIHL